MEEKNAKLFVNSPNAIPGNTVDKCDTSSAKFQSEKTGLVDGVGTEEEILSEIRTLVSILPCNNEEDASYTECSDDLNRACSEIENATEDTAIALAEIADDHVFFETQKNHAKDMVTGFIRLNGMTVGAVANRGFAATMCAERSLAKAAAKLTYAFANATVPKVNVVIGKAFGSAYVTMNSKSLGADMVYAWPTAEIGMMEADLAAKIMYADADAETINEKAKEYAELQSSPVSAARRGYVDTIIQPADTRKYVIGAFEMLFTKREESPMKKHGTV